MGSVRRLPVVAAAAVLALTLAVPTVSASSPRQNGVDYCSGGGCSGTSYMYPSTTGHGSGNGSGVTRCSYCSSAGSRASGSGGLTNPSSTKPV